MVQDARKAAGLQVSDRIVLGLGVDGEPAEALEAHRAFVAAETLATEVVDRPIPDATYAQTAEIDSTSVRVSLRRA